MSSLIEYEAPQEILLPGEGGVQFIGATHPLKTALTYQVMPEGLSLTEMLDIAQPDPVLLRDAVVFIDDVEIPRENWARVRPRAGHTVTARVVPYLRGGEGKNPLRTILLLSVMVATAGFGAAVGGALFGAGVINAGLAVGLSVGQGIALTTFLGGMVISAVGTLLVNTIAPVRLPSLPDPEGKGSPSLFLDGGSNNARPFGQVPQVLGYVRFRPPLGAQTYTESLGDFNFLRMLLVLGYGRVTLSDWQIDNTPLVNFDDFEIEQREGVTGDAPLSLFANQVDQDNFNIILKQSEDWFERTSSLNADELSVDVAFQQGLFFMSEEGNRQRVSVTIQVQYRKVGSSTWLPFPSNATTTAGISTVSGDLITFTARRAESMRHGIRWDVASGRGQYEVRIRRTTADDEKDQKFDVVSWTVMRTITAEDPIAFPAPLAKAALKIRASDQLSGVLSTLSVLAKTVAPDWNAGSSTWVTRETNNPASLFRHVLQGAAMADNLTDAEIDLARLQEWHEFCEARGFTFNMVRDFASSVQSTLEDLAAAGRAGLTLEDGRVSVIIDQPISVITTHITPRNSAAFELEKSFDEPPEAWRVRFVNEDNDYQQDERVVPFPGFTETTASTFATLELPGVTKPDTVYHLARYMANVIINRPERWTVQQDYEALVARRGTRVKLTHDVIAAGQASGRIKRLLGDVLDDLSPGAHDATINGSPLWVEGDVATALHLNGTTDYAQTGSFSNPSDNFTVECRAKSTGATWNRDDCLVSKRDAFILGPVAGTNDIRASVWMASVRKDLTFATAGGFDVTLEHHYAFTFADGVVRLYVDGLQADTVDHGTGTVDVDAGVLEIGRDDGSPTNLLDGEVSEIRLWDAVRTPAEILADQAGTLTGGEANLIGYWTGDATTVGTDVKGLEMDEPVDMSTGTDYGVVVRNPVLTSVASQVVTVDGQDQALLTYSIPLAAASAPDVGDLFGFGILGSETEDAIVLSNEPDHDYRAKITMVPYDEAIFDTDSEIPPEFVPNVSGFRALPVPVITQIVSDESMLVRDAGGSLGVQVDFRVEPLDDFFGVFLEVQQRATGTDETFRPSQVLRQDGTHAVVGDVQTGEYWDFRVRWNTSTQVSTWTVASNVRIVGLSTPPTALVGLTITAFGNQALLRWDEPAELDMRVGGLVQFRHSPSLDSATWATSSSIGQAAQARSLFASLPLKAGTYLARVYDTLGNPGGIASVSSKQAAVLQYANVTSITENPDFLGTHSSTYVDADDDTLRLTGLGLFDDITDLDALTELIDSTGGVAASGTYLFSGGFDLTTVERVRLTTSLTVISVNVNELLDDRTDSIDLWEDFDGTLQAEADVVIFVRSTDDDPAGSPTWTEWQRLESGEFEARGFEFKAELTTNDPSFNIAISEMAVTAEEVV